MIRDLEREFSRLWSDMRKRRIGTKEVWLRMRLLTPDVRQLSLMLSMTVGVGLLSLGERWELVAGHAKLAQHEAELSAALARNRGH